MPIYDFKCPSCGKTEDRLCRISERSSQVCDCGSSMVQKVVAARINRSWEDKPLEVRGHGVFTSRKAFDAYCDKNDAMPISSDSSWYSQHDWEAESAAEDMCVDMGYQDSDDFRRNYKKDVAEKNADQEASST